MPLVEEVEHRVSRLEIIVEDIIEDRPVLISQRLGQLYEKTERDKTEILTQLYKKTEKDKAELKTEVFAILTKTERDKTEILTKTERDKTELLEKMSAFYVKIDKDKREFIPWMIGLFFWFRCPKHNSDRYYSHLCY
ncbi:hypothetical protein M1M93_00950 [Thermodesulfovibrionales bacterium]|nr:hypothetical protein [Thermodesulfovibrionales bacterium]